MEVAAVSSKTTERHHVFLCVLFTKKAKCFMGMGIWRALWSEELDDFCVFSSLLIPHLRCNRL